MLRGDCLPSLGPGAVHGLASHVWRELMGAYVGNATAEDAAADRARMEENRIVAVALYDDRFGYLCRADDAGLK